MYYRRASETANILQKMVRDCRHTTRDSQGLQIWYKRRSETADMIQEGGSETADMIQKMVREDGQRLQT